MRRLVTQRLDLEPLEACHAAELFPGLCDAELYQFLSERPPESVELLRQRYERLSVRMSPDGRERWWNWVVRGRSDHVAMGYVQATITADEAEVAYVLLRPYWRQGFGCEAVSAMIAELWQCGVHTLRARADAGNLRSRKLLERLGFVERAAPEFVGEEDRGDAWYVRERCGMVAED